MEQRAALKSNMEAPAKSTTVPSNSGARQSATTTTAARSPAASAAAAALKLALPAHSLRQLWVSEPQAQRQPPSAIPRPSPTWLSSVEARSASRPVPSSLLSPRQLPSPQTLLLEAAVVYLRASWQAVVAADALPSLAVTRAEVGW